MNESEQTSASTTPPSTGEPSKPNLLRKVLFGILAVMVLLLIYEYALVWPSYKSAEKAVDDLLEGRIATANGPATPEEVRAVFGKEPVGGLQDKGTHYLEHYRWRRALPWQTLNLYVIYEHTDPPRLFNSTRPLPPLESDVPFSGSPSTGAPATADTAESDAAPETPSANGEDGGEPASEAAASDEAESDASSETDAESTSEETQEE